MGHRVKITRTETKIYNVEDQDMDWYKEQEVVNAHMAVLNDLESLKDGAFYWDDLDAIDADDVVTTFTAVFLGEDDVEIRIDENNKTRDEELFPNDDEEDDVEPAPTFQEPTGLF